MTRRFAFALCAVACTLLAQQGRAASTPAPYEMVRALSALQDQIAAGNTIAQVGQTKMIARIGERFSLADPSVWMDRRNARALVLYLLGGGNAAALDGLVDHDQVAKGYGALFDGAMAYALGDDAKARSLLAPIDVRTIPSGLGGHVALVQATLIANQDRPKALQLLDLARLLEPGTLVEEAALRKEMFLIGATGDLDKAALLARRYVHAFSKSLYADNFRQLQVKTAVEIGGGNTLESNAKLDAYLNGVERSERRTLLVAVARNALLNGRLVTARYAAATAETLSDKPDAETARADVYFGAAAVVGDDYDHAVKVLTAVDAKRLNERDASLRASALEVARMIRASDSTLDAAGGADGLGDQAGIKQAVAEAERSLAGADALLKRKIP